MESIVKNHEEVAIEASEMSWSHAGNSVVATLYDNGEWQVFYGTDGAEPTNLFMKNIYSKQEAYVTIGACIDYVFGVEE
jgi:hypothetical protein